MNAIVVFIFSISSKCSDVVLGVVFVVIHPVYIIDTIVIIVGVIVVVVGDSSSN